MILGIMLTIAYVYAEVNIEVVEPLPIIYMEGKSELQNKE